MKIIKSSVNKRSLIRWKIYFDRSRMYIGYMDTKLGFREEELRNLSKSNPVMMEMLNELKEIKNKLNSLDENKIKSA